jgi:hypothetical protein
LLNVHPNILSVHEVQIQKPYHKGRLQRSVSGALFGKPSFQRDTPNLLDKMWGTDRHPFRNLWLHWAAFRGESVLVRALLKNTVKDRVDCMIDKVPNPKVIGSYARKYPDAKLIYLHRNPFGVVNSILRKSKGSVVPGVSWGPRLDGVHAEMKHEILAATMYLQCLRWLREAQQNAISIHEVFYENFVDDPERVYQGVFDFLGIEVSPETRRDISKMFSDFPLRKKRLCGWRTELTAPAKTEVSRVLEAERKILPDRYLDSLRTAAGSVAGKG